MKYAIVQKNNSGQGYRIEFEPLGDRVSVIIIRISSNGNETVVSQSWEFKSDLKSIF